MKQTIKRSLAALCIAAATGLCGFGLTAAHAGMDKPTTAPSTQPTAAVNKKCPVSGDDIDPTVTAVYKGKTYAFCCSDCVKKFKEDPAKYATAAK